jgi:hypothetical protein
MAYSLSPWLKPRFFITGTNRPLAGGLMYTYKAGTTDNATTYSDDAGTPNTNPIVLDSDGQCDLFLDDAVSYRIILKNSAGVTQFDKDRIASLGSTQVQSFNSIAALRLRSGTTIANAAKTLGYSVGDGGSNLFVWSSASTAADNSINVIKPTAVSGAGRWLSATKTLKLEQCGCNGDGVFNNSTALANAATVAVSDGLHLVGSTAKTYLISGSDVNLRNVSFDFTESNVSLSGGYKLLIGGTATSQDNKTQRLGIVTRSGGATSTPTVRVMGAKDQDIHIRVCDFLQLYADTSTGNAGPDYSIAYSTFYINKVDKLELTNNAATPNSATQWINENTFFLKRCISLYINGTYPHNNNIFHAGTFEGASIINIDVGNSNILHDIRFEGTPSVTFGTGTWGNKIYQSWSSNPHADMEYECKEVTVIDNGEGNFVRKLAHGQQIRTPIISINSTTCLTFSNVAGATNFARSPNFTTLRNVDVQRYGIDQFQRNSNRIVFDCPLIQVFVGDSIQFQASHALFRPHVQIYDANKVQITNENVDPATYKYIRANSGFVWNGVSKYFHSTDVSEKYLTIKSSDVAYIKFDIMSGGASSGLPFDYLSVILATYRHGAGVFACADRQVTCNAATPTTPVIGWASELGTQVAKTTVTGNWNCTFAFATTLSVAGVATDLTVTLSSVTGITSGDVIGIQLDSGAAHWTTVNGAPVGNVVTLTVALPSNATIGKLVVLNRWV